MVIDNHYFTINGFFNSAHIPDLRSVSRVFFGSIDQKIVEVMRRTILLCFINICKPRKPCEDKTKRFGSVATGIHGEHPRDFEGIIFNLLEMSHDFD